MTDLGFGRNEKSGGWGLVLAGRTEMRVMGYQEEEAYGKRK